MANEYIYIFNDYPVKITAEELKNERNIDIAGEYGTALMVSFMSDVHSSIYEGAIYATGDKGIKNKIIETHLADVENSIKRALILQAAYMHEEGNPGTESGITITADGQRAVVSRKDLRSKAVCIAALDALKACSCPILYAGEDV